MLKDENFFSEIDKTREHLKVTRVADQIRGQLMKEQEDMHSECAKAISRKEIHQPISFAQIPKIHPPTLTQHHISVLVRY